MDAAVIHSRGDNESYFRVANVKELKPDAEAEFWTIEALRAAQRNDTDVSYILSLMESSTEKPLWDAVARQSYDVRVLWHVWLRLYRWNDSVMAGDPFYEDEETIPICRFNQSINIILLRHGRKQAHNLHK